MFLSLLYLSLFNYQKADFAVQERFRVEYVMLDVKAVDKDGNLVTDLKMSDFEIKENRKSVQPDFFEVLDFRQDLKLDELPTDSAEAKEKVEKEVRQIIIAMDLEWTQPRDALNAFVQMEKFLKGLPNDVVYRINLYSLDRGSISKGFVDTPERVLAYLEEFKDRHLARWDRNSPYRVEGGEGMLEYDSRSRTGGSLERRPLQQISRLNDTPYSLEALEAAFQMCGDGFAGSSSGNDTYANCVVNTLNEYMERMQDRARQAIGGLEILTYKFEDNDDLKVMLFVSPSFSYTDLSSAQQLANAYLSGDQFRSPGSVLKGRNFNLENEFKRVLHACIKNRVIFNTVDIFNKDSGELIQVHRRLGGRAPHVSVGTKKFIYSTYQNEIAEGIAELAEESGGRFFQSFTLTNPLQKVFDEDRYFYQIGYPSPDGRPGRYREIKIKCKRKGVKLYYRKGYYGGK